MKIAITGGTGFRGTVIYDGSCQLCAGNLKWFHRLDWLHHFDSLPYQARELHTLFPQLDPLECEKAMQLVMANGRVYSGSEGFRHLFLRMPSMLLVGLVMSVPPLPWVLQHLYRRFAPYRYLLSGRCELAERK